MYTKEKKRADKKKNKEKKRTEKGDTTGVLCLNFLKLITCTNCTQYFEKKEKVM